jgi:hypothetical protein
MMTTTTTMTVTTAFWMSRGYPLPIKYVRSLIEGGIAAQREAEQDDEDEDDDDKDGQDDEVEAEYKIAMEEAAKA